eukprot:scaffold258192_cov13-Tisochrysis_lutea.AAC.2
MQEGHCKPGEVLFGTDSHTCNAGAFGQFATGIGNTDAGFILGTGKLLIKVCCLQGASLILMMCAYGQAAHQGMLLACALHGAGLSAKP